MCGINGVYLADSSKEINRALFEASTQSLRHRGPDHQGTWFNPGIALGHNRLSILDISAAGNQPFFSPDKQHAIVFNGEIFNYAELKKELEDAGEKFTTTSDTEILLRLLMKYGIDVLHRLNGFFALAYYNINQHELWLVRDRFGEKPVFYSWLENERSLCFASELNAITSFMKQKVLCKPALNFLLHLSYIPAPFTILENVYKLEPGHLLRINASGKQKISWYKLEAQDQTELLNDEKEVCQELVSKFQTAVKRRMIADVPVAGFLSGGIDSSLVSAIAKQLNPSYETFSLGFNDNKFIDESNDAVMAAKRFGINHHVIKLNEDEVLQNVNDILRQTDEPFGDSSMIALYSLCKKTRGKFKVILSGDGADEVFAGYNKHYALYRAGKKSMSNWTIRNLGSAHRLLPKSRNSRLGNKFRQLEKMHKALKRADFERYWYLAGFNVEMASTLFPAQTEYTVFKHELRDNTSFTDFNKYLYYDTQLVLPGDMLYKVDRASMLNALEIRSPFMDHELIEYAFSVKGSLKIKNGNRKHLIKTAFGELLGKEIIQKPKHGFEVPLHQWLNGPLKQETEKMFADSFIREQGIFDTASIKRLMQKLYSDNPGDTASTVWTLLCFQYSWKNHLNA